MRACLMVLAVVFGLSSYSVAQEQKISIMSYNVENLFDTVHDQGKDDWEFLPLAQKNTHQQKSYCSKQSSGFKRDCFNRDWSDSVLSEKLKRIANTVLQIDGRGPDILILAEVENIHVLTMLNDQYLQAAGYKTISLIEGDDRRGIDIGVLSRLPLAGTPQLHRINFSMTPLPQSRGIMDVPLKLPDGETLYVLGVHLPSQSNPHQERVDAVNTINQLLLEKGNANVVVGGDFNIIKEEDADSGLFSKVLASQWQVSHIVGCADCKGSHYYGGGWSFLDALLFSKTMDAQNGGHWRLNVQSLRTPTQGQYQMTRDQTPARFNEHSPVGVSDHLPMYGEIISR